MRSPVGHRDQGEAAIVRALRGIGAVVVRHNGKDEPDLFVGLRGRWVAVEVKEPAGPRGGVAHRKLTPGQEAFHRAAHGAGLPIHVVRSPEQALAALGVEVVRR